MTMPMSMRRRPPAPPLNGRLRAGLAVAAARVLGDPAAGRIRAVMELASLPPRRRASHGHGAAG